MSTEALKRVESHELAANSNVFAAYLEQLGLPTSNVIASTEERANVATNLPAFLSTLPSEEKRDARYLSKFVGATAIGLFDAGLNYLWNEVVLNLRRKVLIYGLDLFFDAAVGGKARELYKTEDDLSGLKDKVLLDTCRKLELISDIVYRKVDHILTMRNEVAASHPNVESIGGFELLGWLQTCVKDILQDRPSESAIRIRALVDNLRSTTQVIDANTINRLKAELKNLSLPHVNNLLVTLFGMFVSPESDQVLRKNIASIAPAVWGFAAETVKMRTGVIIDGYRTNLEDEKLKRGLEFLSVVDGRMYETLPAKTVALDTLSGRLKEAHNGWDNFYHEPPIMKEILTYCRKSTDIPPEVLPTLIRTVLKCRLGRGLKYNEGVSPAGRPLYDRFFSILDENGVTILIATLFHSDVNALLYSEICQKHLHTVLTSIRTLIISDRLKQAVDFLLQDIPNSYRATQNPAFLELTSPFINWKYPPPASR